MKQLYVFCEGQTEQGFCAQVLQPHLFPSGEGCVHTLAVGEKDHRHLYGLGRQTRYERVRKFICNTIKQREREGVYFTTLFDLYGLPDDFPGKDENVRNPANPTLYVEALERAFGDCINYHRFIPSLQLHEYETILFASPEAFAVSFEDCEEAIQHLHAIADEVGGEIERINDGTTTAPSKRIIAALPPYDGSKATAGPDIAEYIGVDTIRDKCPHFDRWLSQLERLLRDLCAAPTARDMECELRVLLLTRAFSPLRSDSMKNLTAFVLLALFLALTGCGTPPAPGTDGKKKIVKPSGHTHGKGPNGGTVFDFGKYHAEITIDHDKKECTITILGADEKTLVPVAAKELTLTTKATKTKDDKDVPALTITLQPKEEKDGKATQFVGTDPGLANEVDFEGTLNGEVDGKPSKGDFKEED